MIRVNGKKHTWWKGMTVDDLLNDYPKIYRAGIVRINLKLITRESFEDKKIPDNAEISIIPMVAGG